MKFLRFFIVILLFITNIVEINATESSVSDYAVYGIGDSNVQELTKEAKNTIKNLSDKTDNELIDNDLKELSLSYAILKDEVNSTKYATLYIKKTSDFKILNNDLYEPIENTMAFIDLKDKYLPKLNIYIIFFFATGIISMFISIMLNIRRKGDFWANFLISAFLFFHAIFVMNLCLFLSNYVYVVPELFSISISFSFLYGPLIYLYFKRITTQYEFTKLDLLHFLPTLLLIAYLFPNYIMSVDEKLHVLINRDVLFHSSLVAIIIIKSISLFVYSVLAFRLHKKYINNCNTKYKEIIRWKKNLAAINLAYAFTYALYGVFLIFQMAYVFIYPQSFLLAGFMLYIAAIAYVQPRVFSKKYIFDELSKIKYQKSGLTEDFSVELKEQLLQLLKQDKIYRKSNLTLEKLAESLNTTRHNVSQVINEHFSLNYFNLINKFRINEAIDILKSDFNRDLKIIDVAYDVGFNNKVTFNKAFKAETNLTPSEFINNLDRTRLAPLG